MFITVAITTRLNDNVTRLNVIVLRLGPRCYGEFLRRLVKISRLKHCPLLLVNVAVKACKWPLYVFATILRTFGTDSKIRYRLALMSPVRCYLWHLISRFLEPFFIFVFFPGKLARYRGLSPVRICMGKLCTFQRFCNRKLNYLTLFKTFQLVFFEFGILFFRINSKQDFAYSLCMRN